MNHQAKTEKAQIIRILLSTDYKTLRYYISCRNLRRIAKYLKLDLSDVLDKDKDILANEIWENILNWRYGNFYP